MSDKHFQNSLDRLIDKNFPLWNIFNNVFIWLACLALFYYNILPLVDASSITNLLTVMETFEFIPLLMDFFLFVYLIELLHFLWNKNRLTKILAKYYTYNFLKNSTYFLAIFIAMIGFFIPVYNPFYILNQPPSSDQIFSLITIISFMFLVIVIILARNKSSFTTIIFSLNLIFLIISILTIYSLFITPVDSYYSAYMIPVIIYLSIQTMLYLYAKKLMNQSEFFNFVSSHTVPMKVLITAKVFDSENEYKEAMAKGAKNKFQLSLINYYKADSYKNMVETRDHNFPDYQVYLDAKAKGIKFYREWQSYNQNVQKIDDLNTSYSGKKKSLTSLIKKSNKITMEHLMVFIGSNNIKPLLYWFAKLPDNFPM